MMADLSDVADIPGLADAIHERQERRREQAHTETETIRCVQCGWTIAPDRLELVTRNPDATWPEEIPLHRGGCPQPREEP